MLKISNGNTSLCWVEMKIIRSWIDRALTESEEERETSTVGTAGAEREILGVWEGGGRGRERYQNSGWSSHFSAAQLGRRKRKKLGSKRERDRERGRGRQQSIVSKCMTSLRCQFCAEGNWVSESVNEWGNASISPSQTIYHCNYLSQKREGSLQSQLSPSLLLYFFSLFGVGRRCTAHFLWSGFWFWPSGLSVFSFSFSFFLFFNMKKTPHVLFL